MEGRTCSTCVYFNIYRDKEKVYLIPELWCEKYQAELRPNQPKCEDYIATRPIALKR